MFNSFDEVILVIIAVLLSVMCGTLWAIPAYLADLLKIAAQIEAEVARRKGETA